MTKEELKKLQERIENLEKENTELKEINAETLSQLNLDNGELIIENEKLRKENTRLKLELEALDGQIPWKDIKDKSEVIGQLAKAKELLAKWVELYKPKIDTFLPTPIQADTEQFLKE